MLHPFAIVSIAVILASVKTYLLAYHMCVYLYHCRSLTFIPSSLLETLSRKNRRICTRYFCLVQVCVRLGAKLELWGKTECLESQRNEPPKRGCWRVSIGGIIVPLFVCLWSYAPPRR